VSAVKNVISIDGCVACFVEVDIPATTILDVRFLREDLFVAYHNCEDAAAIFMYEPDDISKNTIDLCMDAEATMDTVVGCRGNSEMLSNFVHEYAHFVDRIRWKGDFIDHDLVGEFDPEYNTADEYNAYWLSGLYEFFIDKPKKLFNFLEFLEYMKTKSETIKEMIEELNDKYRRRFLSRTYRLYDVLRDEV
jgi:hypothetical protein